MNDCHRLFKGFEFVFINCLGHKQSRLKVDPNRHRKFNLGRRSKFNIVNNTDTDKNMRSNVALPRVIAHLANLRSGKTNLLGSNLTA